MSKCFMKIESRRVPIVSKRCAVRRSRRKTCCTNDVFMKNMGMMRMQSSFLGKENRNLPWGDEEEW